MPIHKPKFILKLKERALNQYPAKLWFRTTVLFLAFIFMVLLSSTNSVQLRDEYDYKKLEQTTPGATAQLKDLIKSEHQNAVDEIKMMLEQMDTWYHYKFILIGGVIVVFLGHIGILGRQNTASHRASERMLERVLLSNRGSDAGARYSP